MNKQDKLMLDDLVKQVKEGKLQISELPVKWQEQVQALLDNE
jgi:DNA recombination-dependent growth factor C